MVDGFWASVIQKVRNSKNSMAITIIQDIRRIYEEDGMSGVQKYFTDIEKIFVEEVNINEN